MTPSQPFSRDLVLVGGGHAHALILASWARNPLSGVRLTLVTPEPVSPYTGMLPGLIAGHYQRADLDIDMVRLTRRAGGRLALATVCGIDHDAKRITLDQRPPISYDFASINVGAVSAMPEIPGYNSFVTPAKPLDGLACAWTDFLAKASEKSLSNIVVLGGGAAGIELSLAMAHRLRSHNIKGHIRIIEAGPVVIRELGTMARRRLCRRLERAGIQLHTNACLSEVDDGRIILADGQNIPANFVVGAAGSRAPSWLAGTGLALTDGRIAIDEMLLSVSHRSIFAVGDCADLVQHPRPKAGVFAVRQAPVLLQNLRAALTSGRWHRFRPQRRFLKILSAGGRDAVADKFGLAAGGHIVWRAKDRIDRRFMRKFTVSPLAISDDRLKGIKINQEPLCGGCGSKLTQNSLRCALPKPIDRPDILVGIGDDAAVLDFGNSRQALACDHLRAFTSDPWILSRVAALHALGDIWAIGAIPRTALATVVLPRMAERLQSETLREIMSAAQGALAEEGAVIVGGHSSQGSELMVGFTIVGSVEKQILTKTGARPGDQLILTRSIGTGVILAAEMRGAADGQHVAEAYAQMLRSSGPAARILANHAQAMTDVTGFGLAGHLMEMLEHDNLSCHVEMSRIPLLSGALELARSGIRSTIWNDNARLSRSMQIKAGDATDLIFDPQTAGGLLAAVRPENAIGVLEKLNRCGEAAAVIGEVGPKDHGVTVS